MTGKTNPNYGKIKAAALGYLGKHQGQIVTAKDMAADTGFTEKQLAHSIYQMRRKDPRLEREILVYQGGHTWKYLPSKEPEPEPEPQGKAQPAATSDDTFYERVGKTGAGTVIVRDIEDGTMFKLVELDI